MTLVIWNNIKSFAKLEVHIEVIQGVTTLYKNDRIDLLRLNILLKNLEFKDSSVCSPQPKNH